MRSSPPTPSRWSSIGPGRRQCVGFFVGQVMKASKGQANPQMVNEVLTKKLDA